MKYTMDDLLNIMIKLRSENGCPWDRAQDHESIKRSMIEEVYEAIEALDNHNDKMFANELGDVLLQVVFHARISEERGAFNFDNVLYEICSKLIQRHPHVFEAVDADDPDAALDVWEKSKKKEKNLKSHTDALKDVASNLPALIRAEKVQKKAKKVGFDWDSIDGAAEKVYEELDEIKQALKNNDQRETEEEFGDLLFAAVNLGRFLNADPEMSLTNATNKFIKRFEKMENTARDRGLELTDMSADELDALWNEIKK